MKNYLELVDTQGRDVFVAAESIIAIFNAGNKTCSIVCEGIPTPIIVGKSHHEIIKKLVDIQTFKLIKF